MIKARLRLQAAVSLLKLSSIEIYANLVLKNLIMLAITLQVSTLFGVHAPSTYARVITGHIFPCAIGATKQIRAPCGEQKARAQLLCTAFYHCPRPRERDPGTSPELGHGSNEKVARWYV
jgi:hypothetical protein